MSVKHFTIKDPATWYQPGEQQIFLGDVVNASNGGAKATGTSIIKWKFIYTISEGKN